MKAKALLMCMVVCTMMMGLVSCEIINNENSPIVGLWAVEGDKNRTVEFDHDKATIICYNEDGEVFSKNYFEYVIQRDVIYFGVYAPDLQLYAYECMYELEGNKLIINGLNVLLYYGSSAEPPMGYESDVVLVRK